MREDFTVTGMIAGVSSSTCGADVALFSDTPGMIGCGARWKGGSVNEVSVLPARHKLDVDAYYRMAEMGLLGGIRGWN